MIILLQNRLSNEIPKDYILFSYPKFNFTLKNEYTAFLNLEP